MTTTTESLADRIVALVRAADYPGLVAHCAPDVLLDVNLPTWRFQLQGRDAVRAYFEEQVAGMTEVRCPFVRSSPVEGGVLVESEVRFVHEGGEHLWRAMDRFLVDGGQVVEHVQYCTGCWTPEDIARHAAEAPMVRW